MTTDDLLVPCSIYNAVAGITTIQQYRAIRYCCNIKTKIIKRDYSEEIRQMFDKFIEFIVPLIYISDSLFKSQRKDPFFN